MKRTAFAVLILLLGIGVATWWARSSEPQPPSYQGQPLSWYLRSAREGKTPSDAAIKAIESGGTDAVRWLTWAVEHGRLPDPRPSNVPLPLWRSILKSLSPSANRQPDYYNERAEAVWALRFAYPASEAAIPALTRVMEDSDDSLASAAAETLSQLQPSTWSVLIQAAGNRSPRIRLDAVRSLVLSNYVGHPPSTDDDITRVVGALAKAFTDSDPKVRAEAACSFGNCGNVADRSEVWTAALPDVLKLLSDPNPAVRTQSAWAVHVFGPKASVAVPQMVEMLHDSDPEVRSRMALALSRADSKERRSMPALLKLAQDPELKCRVAAAASLGKFGVKADAVIAELIRRLDDADPMVRGNALESLEQIGPTAIEAIPAMLASMQKISGASPWMVTYRMNEFGPDAVPYLVQALANSNPSVRAGAAAAFASDTPDKLSAEAITALTKAVNDPDEQVRTPAKQALERIKSKR